MTCTIHMRYYNPRPRPIGNGGASALSNGTLRGPLIPRLILTGFLTFDTLFPALSGGSSLEFEAEVEFSFSFRPAIGPLGIARCSAKRVVVFTIGKGPDLALPFPFSIVDVERGLDILNVCVGVGAVRAFLGIGLDS